MIKMEEKFVKDTTKEDHYVKIAVGFKIIYNQNQYLAYTEMPKKKRDIPLEIYLGRVSRLKGNYLIFKCETESEKKQVFDLFRKVFSGEQIEEIEMMDYSNVERMSIVSSDRFDEKMDQYPNFFTLPEKEDDISADIPIPSFFKKKGPKIKLAPTEEIQFVGNNNEVLASNVEEKEELVPVPLGEVTENATVAEPIPTETQEPVTVDMSQPVSNGVVEQPLVEPALPNIDLSQVPVSNVEPVQLPEIPAMPNVDLTQPVSNAEPVQVPEIPAMPNVDLTQAPISNGEPAQVSEPVIPNVDMTQAPISNGEPVQVSEPALPNINLTQEPVSNVEPVQVSESPVMQKIDSVQTPVNDIQPVMPTVEVAPVNDLPPVDVALEQTPIAPMPLDPNTVADMNEEIKVTQVVEGGKKKKHPKNNKKSHATIIVLMIITILLIASIIVVYGFDLIPKKEKEKTPEPTVPKTGNLVCSMNTESSDFDGTEDITVTFVYDAETQKILSSTENGTATMRDASAYQERKAMIVVFSRQLIDTEGQKYSFKYEDANNIYHYSIKRDYEKATASEKDETWLSTFNDANTYYLNKGYTCNGQKKEESSNLTSTTGSETVDYNNWLVTYKKAILSEDKNSYSVTLDVTNNGEEKRTLNGELKLFDADSKNLKTTSFTQDVEAGATISIVLEVPNEGTIDLEKAVAYEIELFR